MWMRREKGFEPLDHYIPDTVKELMRPKNIFNCFVQMITNRRWGNDDDDVRKR